MPASLLARQGTQVCSAHDQRPAAAAATAVRVAVCLSGKPGPLVEQEAQIHWQAAFAPLRPQIHLDFFLHLEGSLHERSRLEAVARSFDAISLCTYNQTNTTAQIYPKPFASRTSRLLEQFFEQTYQVPVNRTRCPPAECIVMANATKRPCVVTGYEQALKWRSCLQNIVRRELEAGTMFDFVLRARPDLEFGAALPAAKQWRLLRRDTVMTLVAIDCQAFARLGGNVSGRVCFTDDALALMPRHAADAVFTIADEYERCIPARRSITPCPGRWVWPECRVLNALSSRNVTFAEFPATQRWAFVASVGPSAAPVTFRRKGVASVWGGAGNLPEHALLSTDLRSSSFARGALQAHSIVT